MKEPLSIFLGYDPRERSCYFVAKHSIERRSTKTTDIRPIKLEKLAKNNILNRPIEKKDGRLWCPISQAPMSTEFAISRFAVPFLKKKGWALFADCDILCLSDISELFALADEKYAVMVVKHEYVPTETTKMDGQVQTQYSRKNWSSVVLWNCSHPSNKNLTIEALNTWPGRDLHAFKWLQDEEIGSLPVEWNYLVDVNPKPSVPKLAHMTLGGPWLPEWPGGSCDSVWTAEYADMTSKEKETE